MNFSNILLNWYALNKRDFPWRNSKNPYIIWLSEIILQQTKTNQGLPYFNKFIASYTNVIELAKADENDILNLWQGLGYYSRARNLHFAANQVVKKFNGVFPSTYKDLIQLKGIGDYTASAISSICINEPNAVVDGNVFRVLARIFDINTPINSSKGIKDFKIVAQNLLPQTKTGDYNQAIMDFGAIICTPKNAKCISCVFRKNCKAFNEDKVYNLPIKIKKNKIRKRYFNYLVFIDSENNTKLVQRTSNDIWKNLYQFPLIESDSEINEKALRRKMKLTNIIEQDFQLTLFNDKVIKHILSHQHLFCSFWIVQVNLIKKNNVAITNLDKYPVPTLISNFYKKFTTFDK